jgi:tetratricopeptide (TPR) repeat protein
VPDKPDFPGALPPIWNVPHNRNPNFTGREKELAKIHEALSQGGTMALVQPIHGLGGVGKTQLALEYVYRHAAEYELVWWVRAEEPVTLAADYAALAGRLGLPEAGAEEQDAVVAAVRDSLARRDDWLLVLDNARDPEEVRAYLPPSCGRVLVTSRNSSWRRFGIPLPVNVMPRKEAVAFLLKRSGSKDDGAAKELAEALGCLPLALAQAAAYVDESGTSLGHYLDLFRRRQTELLARGKPGDYHDTVATTWDLAFRQVAEESTAAVELLQLCAFFAPDRIPLNLITDGVELLPEALAAAVADEIALDEALGALRRFSLVELQDGAVSVHRLVQAVTRERLPDEDRSQRMASALALVGHAFPDDWGNPKTWHECLRLLPHALAVTEQQRDGRASAEKQTRLLVALVSFLHSRGQYGEAMSLARCGLELSERVLGPEHPDTLASMNGMAELLYSMGDHAGAEPLLRRALEARERVLGPDHPDTMESVNNLAVLLSRRGDYAGAEPLYRRALDTRERVLGPDHPDTMESVHNLAALLQDMGDYAAAQPLYRRALEASERVLGPEHSSTLHSVSNLAVLLRDMGDYAGAEPLYRRALDARERVLGPEHPDTLTSVNNLAGLLSCTGDYAGAESLYRRALDARERVLGPEHPDTLGSVNNLAGLLKRTGDYAGAEPLYRRALEASERVLGPEHPDTLGSVNNLAGLLDRTGDYAGAEPLYRRALEARERVLGPEHPDTLGSVNNLAGLLSCTGEYADSESLHRRTLDARERVLGPDHPSTLGSVNNLAVLLSRTGDYAGAEPLLRRALESRDCVLGPEHPDTLVSVQNLGFLLSRTGDYAGAEPLFRRALEASERVLGPEHPDVAISLNNLAILLQKTDRLSEAEPLMRRHVVIFRKSGEATGREHPHMQTAIANYRRLLAEMGFRKSEIRKRVQEASGIDPDAESSNDKAE